MLKKYKVALVQLNSGDNLKENLGKIEKYIIEAASQGAKLVAFPEMMNLIQDEGASVYSEDEQGETYHLLEKLAKKYRLFIHGGSISETIDGSSKIYNTTYFFDDDGINIAKYRKIHTFDITDPFEKSYKESNQVENGNKITVVQTKLGIFGFAICYDLRFPEIYRLMALSKAQIIINPANFTMMTGKDHWEALIKARAIENSFYMLAPNQCGQNKRMLAYGNSLVINPWGTVIARMTDAEGILYSEVDLSYLNEIRDRMQTIENRQKAVYRLEEN